MLSSTVTLVIHVLVTIAVSLRILYRKLAVSTTLAWIILIAALPVFGLALYFLFGDHRMGRRRLKAGEKIRRYYQMNHGVRAKKIETDRIPTSDFYQKLSAAMANETGFYPCDGNKISLISDSNAAFARMIEDINSATLSCHLEFYIVDVQGAVIEVLEALREASIRGVECRLLADDFGSRAFLKSDARKRLEDVGVSVQPSLKVGFIKSVSKRTDLRNHRKLVIIDGRIGYLGSLNLADPAFFKQSAGVGQWIDILARVEGDIVSSLACVFNSDYIFDTVGTQYSLEDLREFPVDRKHPDYDRDAVLQLVPSGPELQSSVIHEALVCGIFGARKSVIICTPYFVPDETTLLALTNAARRGVDVSLILPKSIDSRLARQAGEATFQQLFDAGVKIFKNQDGLLHTKAVVVDGEVALIGTVNIDTRSFYLNLELTLIVYDPGFLWDMETLIVKYIEASVMLDPKFWAQRSQFKRFKENVARLASPVL